jgi:hypothetical protein
VKSVSWPGDTNFNNRISKRAVPAFVKLYRTEKSPEVRNELVDAIRRLEDEAFWRKISGNPAGIVVIPHLARIRDGVLEFNVNINHTRAKITKVPGFRFQKIKKDGSVSEPRPVEATVPYEKNQFDMGWSGGSVVFHIPVAGLEPGLYRVWLEGNYQGIKWRSESIELTVPDLK